MKSEDTEALIFLYCIFLGSRFNREITITDPGQLESVKSLATGRLYLTDAYCSCFMTIKAEPHFCPRAEMPPTTDLNGHMTNKICRVK